MAIIRRLLTGHASKGLEVPAATTAATYFPSTNLPFRRYVPTRSLHQHRISRIYLHRVACLLFVPRQERLYSLLCKNRAKGMNILKDKYLHGLQQFQKLSPIREK